MKCDGIKFGIECVNNDLSYFKSFIYQDIIIYYKFCNLHSKIYVDFFGPDLKEIKESEYKLWKITS